MAALLKVYSRINEPAGHVIYRINREFVKRAPANVVFVDSPKCADFQIVQCLGAGSLQKIWNDKFVLFQHGLVSLDISCLAVWRGIFGQALMVVSFADLPSLLNDHSFNFHLTPWGVDTAVFRDEGRTRTKGILTTGWSISQEAIEECYLAARLAGKEMINVGEDFHLGPGFSAVSRITDEELCALYNECEFVSGLRYREGFEVSVIEGLACGCRPIGFDLPVYRTWFEGHLSLVSPCRGAPLTQQIHAILEEGPKKVSAEEGELVRSNFNWETLTADFWAKVLNYV